MFGNEKMNEFIENNVYETNRGNILNIRLFKQLKKN